MNLRPYQEKALQALEQYLREDSGDPLMVAPTGSGKSVMIGEMTRRVVAEDWPDQRVLILSHVKELIAQNHERLNQIWPEARAGICSSGLKRHDCRESIILGTIRTVQARLGKLGVFQMIMVDEAHLIPPKGMGTYGEVIRFFREKNPHLRVVGWTATPYRTGSGPLVDSGIFTGIAYSISIEGLIRQKYLCPVKTPSSTLTQIDTSATRIRGGEFVGSDLAAAADSPDLTCKICQEIIHHGDSRSKWLIFGCGVDHAEALAAQLRALNVRVATVTGKTPPAERDEIIQQFRDGQISALCNAQVLSTGFDDPEIDLIAVARPTWSPGLWVQMVGRGMRISPGKKDCLVMDFGGNLHRHGPIDQAQARKPGPPVERDAPPPPPSRESLPQDLAGQASTGSLLSFRPTSQRITHLNIRRHKKPGKPDSVRIDYWEGFQIVASQWLCLDHPAAPRREARRWWRTWMTGELPSSVDQALMVLPAWIKVPEGSQICTKKEGRFTRVIDYWIAA